MPIYHDKRSGRLFVQFDYKKQTFKQYLPDGATRTQARKLETKMRSDAFFQANGMAPRDEILFDDAVQEYLASVQNNKGKYDKAEYVLIAAKPFLKGKLLRSIKPADVERFKKFRENLATMHGRTRQPATIWRELSEVSAFFSYCVTNDYLETNPCSRVHKQAFDNIQDKVLSVADEPEFLAAFDQQYGLTARDVCIVVLNTGLSQRDVLRLTTFNVDTKNRLINLTRGKTKRHAEIPLNDVAWPVIEARLGNGLLFPSEKTGLAMRSVRTALRGACKRVNQARAEAGRTAMPPVTIRDLRRSFATRLFENKVDPLTIARLLTHADLRMIHRYARSSEMMRTAVNTLPKPTPSLPNIKLRLAK